MKVDSPAPPPTEAKPEVIAVGFNPTFKLIDTQDRSKLNEGRSQGLGYAFCLRAADTLTTIQPISACKDYLLDVLYSERTGKPYSAYNLNTKKEGLFDTDTNGYIVMRILQKKAGSVFVDYPGFAAEQKKLMDNWRTMEKCANEIEAAMPNCGKSEFHMVDAATILMVVPDFWLHTYYQLSLYTLFVRMALHWDGKGEAVDFLNKFNAADEMYIWNAAKPKLKMMMDGYIPPQDFSGSPHSSGISGFSFPPQPTK